MITEIKELPKISILNSDINSYQDVFTAPLQRVNPSISSIDLAKIFFSSVPNWVGLLFTLRNKIVLLFGLKVGDSNASKANVISNFKGEIGESLGFFKVYHRTANEIVLGEDDVHLNFRTSLILDRESVHNDFFVSTTVLYHNRLGKIYFAIVMPFHKLIVKSMMKRMIKTMNEIPPK